MAAEHLLVFHFAVRILFFYGKKKMAPGFDCIWSRHPGDGCHSFGHAGAEGAFWGTDNVRCEHAPDGIV